MPKIIIILIVSLLFSCGSDKDSKEAVIEDYSSKNVELTIFYSVDETTFLSPSLFLELRVNDGEPLINESDYFAFDGKPEKEGFIFLGDISGEPVYLLAPPYGDYEFPKLITLEEIKGSFDVVYIERLPDTIPDEIQLIDERFTVVFTS